MAGAFSFFQTFFGTRPGFFEVTVRGIREGHYQEYARRVHGTAEGRILDAIEDQGDLDNTLIFYCADNGASGEGTPNGSVNENKFFNGYPDELSENMKYLDTLGSPDTYNHYPTGWATAFSTPFQMFKRYAQFAGGTCDPMVISWPKGIKARGEVREQYHHATDVAATVLDISSDGVRLELPRASVAKLVPSPIVSALP